MMKLVVIVLLATLAIAKASPPCLGCPAPLSDEKAVKALNNSLTKLAAGEGPNYRIAKINSASSQVIRGIRYIINADLIDQNDQTKTCDIEIIDFKDVEITFNCPNEAPVKKTHSN